MSPVSEYSAAGRVTAAAARTVAAGTARLLAAWCMGSPVPEAPDRRCEGVADLAARRARVSQSMFLTDRTTAALIELGDGGPEVLDAVKHMEMIYDGANAYLRCEDSWTGILLTDPDGPLSPNDPLWPVDALFGASDDVVEIGPEAVRAVPAVRYQLTIDLGRADAALPAGVSVPAGPYRALSRLPAEVWLDAEGVARRISVSTDPSAAADKQVWSIVELWDFGGPGGITLPAADEILSPEAAARLSGGDPP